ncbi:MAG: type II toxin-antitoxin system RelE/ParE family toxin [Rickettsiales bacterium]
MIKIYKQSRAEEDLVNIWLYSFETHGERQADKYYDELANGINLLANSPNLGIACDEIKIGYRRFKIKHHIIYYKITPSILTIIRVLHESMEPTKYFSD